MRLAVLAALTLSPLCAQQLPGGDTLTKQAEETIERVHGLQHKEDMITETAFGGVLSGESTVLADYPVKGYPTFILIDRDGEIVAYETGFSSDQTLRGNAGRVGRNK